MIFMCALILCCYQHLFSFIFNRLLCIKAHLLGIGKEGTKTFRYLTKSFLHSLVPNIFEPAYRFSSTHLLHPAEEKIPSFLSSSLTLYFLFFFLLMTWY